MEAVAYKTCNDGRQWFCIVLNEDAYGLEAGGHAFAKCDDGSIVDEDGHPLDYNESQLRMVRAAMDSAKHA